jgi:hypothetical protein
MLAFLESMRVHNEFHVSLLNNFVLDPNHVIDWNMIQVEHGGEFQVESMCILVHKFKFLRNRAINLVKVQWNYMILNMPRGSTRSPCGKSTHTFHILWGNLNVHVYICV